MQRHIRPTRVDAEEVETALKQPDNGTKPFDRLLVALGVMAAFTMALALVAAVRAPEASGNEPAPAGGSSSPQAVEANIELSEFAVKGDLAIPEGDVTLSVLNAGTMVHNLAFENGPGSQDVNPGETATLHVGRLPAGTYTIFCAIPGHREGGMEARLVVGGDAAAAAAGGQEEMTPTQMDMVMLESMLAFPAETSGKGNQPLEPTEVKADGTKVFDLTASVVDWEVSPGKIVEGWAYNNQIPGPWIKVDVGDSLEINVANQTPLSTDVHWHGIPTPNEMDGVSPYTQDPIAPGDTFTYAFTTERPSIGMYHAHFHSQISVLNGMFGAFQVGPTPIPNGRTISGIEIPADLDVAREIPMVLNDAGTIGLTLNGKSFPATEPYVVTEGDWLVYHYYNEGLQTHPMHQHQFPQLVFAKDGIPLDEPYWADTIAVAPGERYSVLVHADRAGTWVWHCHILNHVETDQGMFGMVTALIVQPADA